MEEPRVRCTLVVDGGPSRRVAASGVMIGREADCDLVASDPRISRRHALVRLTEQGAEIIPLGRQPIEVNRKPHDQACALRDGDRIELPGLGLTVHLAAHRPDPTKATFRIEMAAGSFGVSHSPFVIGGDPSDDLIVKKWPARALSLHVAQRELFVEVGKGTATRNGAEIAAGAMEPLVPGDVLGYRNEQLAIGRAQPAAATTQVVVAEDVPLAVTIEILPRGGRVVLTMADGEHVVFLHDRRLDLVVALLRPPGEYRAGEFIPDDAVSAVVWPRNPTAARTEINVLIARCRKSLVEGGLAGPRLIQRAPTGGATRFAVAPNAPIVVKA